MRISVIIPVLNEEKSIAATLPELERLKPDELIIVDGGSNDGTREVCRKVRRGTSLVAPRAGATDELRRATRDRRRAAYFFMRTPGFRRPLSTIFARRWRIRGSSVVVSIFNWTTPAQCLGW